MEALLTKLAENGVWAVGLAIALSVIGYLGKKLLESYEKRIEEGRITQTVLADNASSRATQIQANQELATAVRQLIEAQKIRDAVEASKERV